MHNQHVDDVDVYKESVEKRAQAQRNLMNRIRELELEIDELANGSEFYMLPKTYAQLNEIKACILKAESLARQVKI